MLDDRKRLYMLATFTVRRKRAEWFFTRVDPDDWHGPYTSEASVCLMIARELVREIKRRDAPPDR